MRGTLSRSLHNSAHLERENRPPKFPKKRVGCSSRFGRRGTRPVCRVRAMLGVVVIVRNERWYNPRRQEDL